MVTFALTQNLTMENLYLGQRLSFKSTITRETSFIIHQVKQKLATKQDVAN